MCENQIKLIKDSQEKEASKLNKKIDDLAKQHKDLTKQNENLTKQHENLNIELNKASIKAHVLEVKLEDQINRSSRKSLIFKGIAEKEGHESWSDTKNILSKVISKQKLMKMKAMI